LVDEFNSTYHGSELSHCGTEAKYCDVLVPEDVVRANNTIECRKCKECCFEYHDNLTISRKISTVNIFRKHEAKCKNKVKRSKSSKI
jgi:hypothetical protein